ncbi:serine hydrolase [Lactobacillus sp. ESL0731]|uniref:serine hydrolase n=1 Tax=unclassified Lactobacillus TaxID=2620435 RepID=UPI0023F7C9C5|nr:MULTISPECIES: serine hydrolase [unclassified Lactobacillus]WEV50593.1 serine hydrolase [Lactobacillus sp. ESL0700]WEV61723.1 serine hydrolase [Lactobacillus sp. ESL0731]
MTFKHKFNRIIVALAAVVLLMLPVAPVSAATQVPNDYHTNQLNLNVKSAIAIDSKTGQLLYGKNINQPLPIASMTKLITVYLTLTAIKEGKLTWQSKVKPTDAIIRVANNKDFSNVPLHVGHEYSIKQLYQATLIESANGAAMLLGQAVSGAQEPFVKKMRQQLIKWQINDAQIYTSCGLPNKDVGADAYPGAASQAENELSAKDMAIVGQHLLTDFPQVIKTAKIARLDFIDQNARTAMVNFNWMLKGLAQYNPQLKVDGLKTGTTDAAGACFIATAKHNGARIITVVMGAAHRDGSDPSRFVQTKELLSYLYRTYRPIIFTKNEVITGLTRMKVHNGKARQINIGMKENSEVWAPINGAKLHIELADDQVEAPVKIGQIATNYLFKAGRTPLISLTNPSGVRLPAKAFQGTTRVNFLVRFWRWLFGG